VCEIERDRDRYGVRHDNSERVKEKERERKKGVGERQRARVHTLTKTQKHLGPCTGVTGRVAVIAAVASGARRLGAVDPLRARRRGVEVVTCVKYLDVKYIHIHMHLYVYMYVNVFDINTYIHICIICVLDAATGCC